MPGALQTYQEERETEALKLQSAARNRMEWFEQVERYVHLEPEQFTYSLLTGSQRIGHENLKLRDAGYVAERREMVRRAQRRAITRCRRCSRRSRCADVTLKNRVIVSPMAMYMAEDGLPNDFHLVHLGARAMGGAAMVFTEMTCVSPDARITPACLGLWNDAQRACLEAHRGLRARADGREDRPAAWTRGTQRLHAPRLGGDRSAARSRELAAHFGVADSVYRRRFADAARSHARGYGSHQAGFRRRHAARRRGRIRLARACTARTAICCPASFRR